MMANVDKGEMLRIGNRVVRCAFAALLLAAFRPHQILAQNLDWSFEAHPYPGYAQMTGEEFELRGNGLASAESPAELCRLIISNAFDVYNDRYPDFRRTGDVDQRYHAWRTHLSHLDLDVIGNCAYTLPFYEIIELSTQLRDAGLSFCGRVRTASATPLETRFQILTGQLIDHVKTGQIEAVAALYSTHDATSVVTLNPDVEYWVRSRLALSDRLDPADWDISHLLPKLDPERIAFLDDAVARGDFSAVVETTGPCAEG